MLLADPLVLDPDCEPDVGIAVPFCFLYQVLVVSYKHEARMMLTVSLDCDPDVYLWDTQMSISYICLYIIGIGSILQFHGFTLLCTSGPSWVEVNHFCWDWAHTSALNPR